MVDKRQLLGMTLEELKGVASEVGLPAYAAKQMADWIYKNLKSATIIQYTIKGRFMSR